MAKSTREESMDRELTLSNSKFDKAQIKFMLGSTPKKHIYQRKAKGGGEWDYVTGIYVKKVLNYVFGWNWDFEVKEHGVQGETIWVLGKLTVRTTDAVVVKEQFGRSDIKFKKDSTKYLDFGNDLKAATTDALKKCASELGIAGDVYGKSEFRDLQAEAKGEVTSEDRAEGRPATENQIQTIKNILENMTEEQKALVDPFNPSEMTFNEAANKMQELMKLKGGK